MPGDYVKRSDVHKAFQPKYTPAINRTFAAMIDSVPAADVVEVRHRKWVWDGGEDMHYYCSLCHHNAYGNTGEILDGEYKYCPSCGAKMDGGMDNG